MGRGRLAGALVLVGSLLVAGCVDDEPEPARDLSSSRWFEIIGGAGPPRVDAPTTDAVSTPITPTTAVEVPELPQRKRVPRGDLGPDPWLFGTLDDGTPFVVELVGDRPCVYVAGRQMPCRPWNPDDRFVVPGFAHHPKRVGVDPVLVFGFLPDSATQVEVWWTDDSYLTEVAVNSYLWAAPLPPGKAIADVWFFDDEDQPVLNLQRVQPSGWLIWKLA